MTALIKAIAPTYKTHNNFPHLNVLNVPGRLAMEKGISGRWCSTALQIRGSFQPFVFVENQSLIYGLKSIQLLEFSSQVLGEKMKLLFIFTHG